MAEQTVTIYGPGGFYADAPDNNIVDSWVEECPDPGLSDPVVIGQAIVQAVTISSTFDEAKNNLAVVVTQFGAQQS